MSHTSHTNRNLVFRKNLAVTNSLADTPPRPVGHLEFKLCHDLSLLGVLDSYPYPYEPLRLVHNILYASRCNRKSVFFQWARTRQDAGIELDSILHVATRQSPVKEY